MLFTKGQSCFFPKKKILHPILQTYSRGSAHAMPPPLLPQAGAPHAAACGADLQMGRPAVLRLPLRRPDGPLALSAAGGHPHHPEEEGPDGGVPDQCL